MSIFSNLPFVGSKSVESRYPQDEIVTRSGERVVVTLFKHASLALEYNGLHIYIDPVRQYAKYGKLPKADVVVVTHSHYDHFDLDAIGKLMKSDTVVVCDKVSAESFDFNCVTMLPGASSTPVEGVMIDAVPAYNITEGHLDFHPKAREDCGYIITLGGSRFYIAGDTENNEDVKAVTDIDVAFLPVNQPYTMTVEQAVDAVKAIKPAIFYPYHYGEVDEKTDVDLLVRELDGITEVRVRPME
jgi:L-ascorbate metabolism protein UlaG (beta-lactamase superfamily)